MDNGAVNLCRWGMENAPITSQITPVDPSPLAISGGIAIFVFDGQGSETIYGTLFLYFVDFHMRDHNVFLPLVLY